MTSQDTESLVKHWKEGSDYDWKTAFGLLKDRKYPYCLFLCHLSIEKLLKALIVKEKKQHAPFTHNLTYLAGKTSLDFSKEQLKLLEEMNEFNLEARYPDFQKEFYKRANKRFTMRYLQQTETLREWLKSTF